MVELPAEKFENYVQPFLLYELDGHVLNQPLRHGLHALLIHHHRTAIILL